MLDFLLSNIGQGLIYAPMVLGVYITYSILDFPDLSVDGTFPLGAAVTAVCLLAGVDPIIALLLSMLAGALAGFITGALHVYLKITNLLCGILVMTGLYSVNLRIMGKSNIALLKVTTLFPSDVENGTTLNLLYALLISLLIIVIIKVILDLYMKTYSGKALLAVGASEQLVTTLSINTGTMKIAGLMIANGLTALSGALMAQYQRFADLGMGSGTMVVGLAAVIIGRTVFKRVRFIEGSTSVIFGAIIYKIVVGLVMRLGLDADWMKLATAMIFVLVIMLQRVTAYRQKASVRKGGDSRA
ncbi:MAG: ABC transporter permease [Christensenellales bacterium]